MARRITRNDPEAAEFQVHLARVFLRVALDPPLGPGPERDAAIRQRDSMLNAATPTRLREIAHGHANHPAAAWALSALDDADSLAANLAEEVT